MYCRNCGNEVSDKAIACPKCGVNPKSEKAFCSSCGVATNANQIACTSCGVALATSTFSFDTSSIEKIDVNSFLRKKSMVACSIALIGCFLPWVKINAFVVSANLNFFQLSRVVDIAPGSILVGFILYLFPLSLLAFILSDFIPPLAPYKKMFSIASIALLAYTILGLILAANPSTPDIPADDSNIFGNAMAEASKAARDMISIGFGMYITAIATIAGFIFSRKGN